MVTFFLHRSSRNSSTPDCWWNTSRTNEQKKGSKKLSKEDNTAAQKRFGAAVNSGKLYEFDDLMTSRVPATGRKMKARGMQIARFEDGKIAERWGSSDELGILKRLGVKSGGQQVIQVSIRQNCADCELGLARFPRTDNLV